MLGIARKKIVRETVSSSTVLGRQLQRTAARPVPLLGSRGYGTAVGENLLLKRGSKIIRTITLNGDLGSPAGACSLRQIGSCFQTDPCRKMLTRFYSSEGDVVEAVVPFMGESVTDGTLATFLKHPGDRVEVDEPIAQIETDKVTIDVASPQSGIIQQLVAKVGDTVEPGHKIAIISTSGDHSHVAPSEPPAAKKENIAEQKPKAEVPHEKPRSETSAAKDKPKAPAPPATKHSPSEPQLPPKERETRVAMTRLRKRVANRLKDSQNTFAMLTTFNIVDMTNLMKLRSDYKDAFVEKHGVKLGFMSGFVKAAVSGLQSQPILNAVIDGDDIIYRHYIDISIAVGTPKGLVVPVVRGAENMNFAEIEKEINSLAKKANDGTISIDEMAGGTFTISNGGVYGSLLTFKYPNHQPSPVSNFRNALHRKHPDGSWRSDSSEADDELSSDV